MPAEVALSSSPLHNLLVIELGQFAAAPYCTMLLADLGARVIKVEPPGGDGIRNWPPILNSESAAFLSLNRNKESIVVDFRKKTGASVIRQLLNRSDVVVENNRPGTLERYGLGYSQLERDLPRLIYCSISGYGQTVTARDRAAFDLVIQAVTGMMSVTGEPNRPPSKIPVPIADFTAGLHAAIAVLAAVLERLFTGRGDYIDIALQSSSMIWMTLLASRYFSTNELPAPLGSAHPMSAPYQAFRAKDGYLTIAIGNQSLWERLTRLLGREDLGDDPRFSTNELRAKNQSELARTVEAVLEKGHISSWLEVFDQAGIPAAKVNNLKEALEEPQLAQRGMIEAFEHPLFGSIKVIGDPIRSLHRPHRVHQRPPLLGEHTRGVLEEFGVSQAEINSLAKEGVICL
ncbi:MAG: CoA transferase [Acidobacteria bacterium]|nr:CoA transferase [Acidobacteriota bacterium]